MLFEKYYGPKDLIVPKDKLKIREAVRAVIFHEGRILMVHSNLGDYKFPGGGVELGESFEEALKREIIEETGYQYPKVMKKIGLVVQRSHDIYEENFYFQMNSHYYLCELKNFDKIPQILDDYEFEQEFTPKWITIDQAKQENKEALNLPNHNGWVIRETDVLNILKKEIRTV